MPTNLLKVAQISNCNFILRLNSILRSKVATEQTLSFQFRIIILTEIAKKGSKPVMICKVHKSTLFNFLFSHGISYICPPEVINL